MYKSHSEIPADIASFFILVSGEDRLEDISLADINGFALMMDANGNLSFAEDFVRELYEGMVGIEN